MIKIKPGPTVERLKQVVEYDPETGIFRWKSRVGSDRITKGWNTMHAGEIAGGMDSEGYLSMRIDGVMLKAHRLAWLYVYGEWPTVLVDHENLNVSDNRIKNLRLATNAQNTCNTGKRKGNASGYKGVSPFNSKWGARIRKDGREIYLGVFDTPEAAHAAYCEAAREMHGEFARAA